MSEEKEIEQSDKISLKIYAKSELYEINVKKESSISELVNDIDALIAEISKSKSFKAKIIETSTQQPQTRTTSSGTNVMDDPIKLIAMGLEISPDDLEKLELIGIKNENIQILKPTKLEASESCLLILAASEFGLHRKSLPYDEWKELCEANNIKSNTTFNKIANNHKNYGNIDKKKFVGEKELMLTTRGVKFIKKALEKL